METEVTEEVYARFERELEHEEGRWGRDVAGALRNARDEGRIRPADLVELFRALAGDDG